MEIAEKWFEAKRGISANVYIISMNYYDVDFQAHWSEGCRGSYDSHEESFSITHEQLSAKDWREELNKEIEVENQKKILEQRKNVEAKLRAKEKAEREQYEALKKKFE